METVLTSLVASLAQQGPVFLMLAIAIYYLKQSDDKKAAANTALIDTLNTERTERIAILEAHVVECNTRHDQAQAKHEALLIRIARIDHIDNLPPIPP